MVNSIPEKVVIESYVRGKTYNVVSKVNKQINQALCGSALAHNANVEIIDKPGYAPLINDKNLSKVHQEAFEMVFKDKKLIVRDTIASGSTDMGDLSCIMPVIQADCGGVEGMGHGNDYRVVNKLDPTVGSAKIQLVMLYLLLKDNAKRAKEVVANYNAPYPSKKAYLDFIEQFFSDGDRITYNDDGTASVKL